LIGMDGLIFSRFLGKKIAFKKRNEQMTFVGKLLDVTKDSIIIEFEGKTQVHLLETIIQVEEGIDDWKSRKSGVSDE